MKNLLLFFVLVLLIPATLFSQVKINEVVYDPTTGNDMIELKNFGSSSVDVSSWWFCSQISYNPISTMTAESGNKNIPAGGILVLSGRNFANNADLGYTQIIIVFPVVPIWKILCNGEVVLVLVEENPLHLQRASGPWALLLMELPKVIQLSTAVQGSELAPGQMLRPQHSVLKTAMLPASRILRVFPRILVSNKTSQIRLIQARLLITPFRNPQI